MPVFRDGRLLAFVQNSAHWSDAGGPSPGAFTPRRPRPTARRSISRRSISSARASSTTRFCASSSERPGSGHDPGRRLRRDRRPAARERPPPGDHRQVRHRADPHPRWTSSSATRRHFSARNSGGIPDGTYSFADAIDFDPMGDRKTPVAIRIAHHDRRRPGHLRPLEQRPAGRSGRSTRRGAWPNPHSSSRRRRSSRTCRRARASTTRSRSSIRAGLVTNAEFPRPISGRLRHLVRGDHRLRLRLLPPDAPRALDGLLREHDEHGRRRL